MDHARARLIAATALALVALAGNLLRARGVADSPPLGFARAALAGVDATFVADSLDATFFRTLGAREVLYRTYAAEAPEPVWVFLGYFDRQQEGSQVHSPRHCYPGSGWNIEAEPSWPAPWGSGEVRSLVVFDGEERRLVCYWYQMRTRVITDVLPLKLVLAREAALRRPQQVVFASISTPFAGDPARAMVRLGPYARAAHDEIQRLFGEQNEPHARAR